MRSIHINKICSHLKISSCGGNVFSTISTVLESWPDQANEAIQIIVTELDGFLHGTELLGARWVAFSSRVEGTTISGGRTHRSIHMLCLRTMESKLLSAMLWDQTVCSSLLISMTQRQMIASHTTSRSWCTSATVIWFFSASTSNCLFMFCVPYLSPVVEPRRKSWLKNWT